MANIVNGFAYPALGATDSSPSIAVGTVVTLDDGGMAVYVQAASALSQYNAVCIPNTNIATNATTARVAAPSVSASRRCRLPRAIMAGCTSAVRFA
jgi:hypothetical protein